MSKKRNLTGVAALVSALTVSLAQLTPVHAAEPAPKAEEKANPCAAGGSRRRSSGTNPCAGNPCAGSSRRKRGGDDANPCAGSRR